MKFEKGRLYLYVGTDQIIFAIDEIFSFVLLNEKKLIKDLDKEIAKLEEI